MIPSRFEYLFLLLMFALIIGSLVWDHLRALLRRPAYYKSLVLCMAVFAVIDRLAVRWNWWVWSADPFVKRKRRCLPRASTASTVWPTTPSRRDAAVTGSRHEVK